MNERETGMNIDGIRPDIAKRMKELCESKRNKEGTAVSAAFIKDGELIAAFACGTQNGIFESQATVSDIYGIGSVSKVFCTLAVMKLVELGKLSLDTPVVEYLPKFTMKDERYKKITLRMCLNHSSGLPGSNLKNFFNSKWHIDGYYEQYYDYFSKSKLKADPGYYSVYCNDGFMLAEMVVADVSGMSFTRFIQDNISKPTGAFSVCSGENIPETYSLVKAKGRPSEYMMTVSAGGILTNMTDCAAIGYLFVDSKGILKQDSINEAVLPQGKSFITDVQANAYGLGWDNVRTSFDNVDFDDNVLEKSGATPSFSSCLLVMKKHNLSAAISLTHDNWLNARLILCELCAVLLEDYGISTKKVAKSKIPAKKSLLPLDFAEKYTGLYCNNFEMLNVRFNSDYCTIRKKNSEGWVDEIL
jgi:CubicO group peptidase (beta-lactamase class C family)